MVTPVGFRAVGACQSVGSPQNDVQQQQTPMHDTPIRNDRAQVYCRTETKEMVRALKRRGETFDEVLRRLANTYDPEANRELEADSDGV